MTSKGLAGNPVGQIAAFGAAESVASILKGMNYSARFGSAIPSITALAAFPVQQATQGIAAQIAKDVAAMTNVIPAQLGQGPAASIIGQSMIADNFVKTFTAQHALMMAQIMPQMDLAESFGINALVRKSISDISSSFSIGLETAAAFQSVVASATLLRDQMTEQGIDDLADGFFDTRPDLADVVEDVPALHTLSKSDQNLVIWFVRICVTLYVGNGLLALGTEYPEWKELFEAFGLFSGGIGAGIVAGELTKKALNKLPQEKPE